MSDRHSQISELLALRDGEPADVSRLAGLSERDQDAVLDQLRDIKQSINALPDVAVDDELWINATPAPRRSAWLRFPMATAASVFLATAVGIYLVAGQFGGSGQVPGLVDGSQQTPAFTTATAWRNAETGVGATIAAGSQRCTGMTAALPIP